MSHVFPVTTLQSFVQRNGVRALFAALAALLALGLLGLSPAALARAQAATLTVCASGCDHTSIQAAVDAANPGDTISIAGETFVENVVVSKTLTLQGAGAGSTVVDGNAAGPVFRTTSGTVTIADMTITNGSDSLGGGIRNNGAAIVATGIAITNNVSSGQGGGIYNANGTLDISDSTFSGNSATSSGGGIRNPNNGVATMTNVVMSGNDAGSGGAINNSGDLTLINSTLSNNSAGGGGGIYNLKDGSPQVGTMTVSGTTISDNVGVSFGAGVANVQGGELTMTNSTISGNSLPGCCSVDGAGLYSSGAGTVANLNNVTITGNDAFLYGGGIGNFGGAAVNIGNSIVAGNSSGSGTAPDCGWDVSSTGYNLIGDTNNCTINGDPTGNLTNVSADLGALQDNGGPTATHALLAGSPAIDAGNNATCEAADQRGISRPQGADCDIGAFEVEAAAGSAPLPSGIVSWWPGDSDADDIVGGNDGTLQNGATFATGMVGQAFGLDGVNDYVGPLGTPSSYSFVQNTGVFTIDAWIKLDNCQVSTHRWRKSCLS